AGNAAEAQNACDQCDDQKRNDPTQHDTTSVWFRSARNDRAVACRNNPARSRWFLGAKPGKFADSAEQNRTSGAKNAPRRPWDKTCQNVRTGLIWLIIPAMKAPLQRPTVPSWGQHDSKMTEPSKLPHHGVPEHQPAAGGIAARARAAAVPQYLAGLNPEQREAVETLDGPVLVLAGAGTGKTRVLTTRIAHILSLGRARPSEILAVTFTNKAAREMKSRVAAMMGQVVEGMPWLGTFHSICVKILRRHAELGGLKSDFTIPDVHGQNTPME